MDDLRAARMRLKWELQHEWPGTLCPCGEVGATDLGHIVYTRHPDSVELYSPLNCCLLHNTCNTRQEALWINVNACLILLERAGGSDAWLRWAQSIGRKGDLYVPTKMQIAIDLWDGGVRAFEYDRIKGAFLTSDGDLQQLDEHIEWIQRNRPLGGEKGEGE